jgi:hypothetical protein
MLQKIQINHREQIDTTTEADRLKAEIIAHCRQNPFFFLTEYAYTFDVHSTMKVRKFPNWDYLRYITNHWLLNRYFVLASSRQVMKTNWGVGVHLWLANFHPGQYIAISSTDEAKAGWGGVSIKDSGFKGDPESLLSRMLFMHRQLPEWLQTPIQTSKEPAQIYFKHQVAGQYIPTTVRAVSSNPHIFNQLTATAVWMDEISKVGTAEEAYQSCLPILGDTGRFTATGTAEGKNILYRLCFDVEN